MARTLEEIDAEMARLKAGGEPPMSGAMRKLRIERTLAERGGDEVAVEVNASTPTPSPVPPCEPPSMPVLAVGDAQFICDALAQMILKGNGLIAKPERCYSDVRSALKVKHILEDACGLAASQRMDLPHWDTLGRERDSGDLFKPGETQAMADGLVPRVAATPAAPATVAPDLSRPTITDRLGNPLPLRRSVALGEPDGDAVVTVGVGGPLSE